MKENDVCLLLSSDYTGSGVVLSHLLMTSCLVEITDLLESDMATLWALLLWL